VHEDELVVVLELAGGDADDEEVFALVLGVAPMVAFECGAGVVVVVTVDFEDELRCAPEEVGRCSCRLWR
jgi:hypothetical protein